MNSQLHLSSFRFHQSKNLEDILPFIVIQRGGQWAILAQEERLISRWVLKVEDRSLVLVQIRYGYFPYEIRSTT
jgi:hypothetical protein